MRSRKNTYFPHLLLAIVLSLLLAAFVAWACTDKEKFLKGGWALQDTGAMLAAVFGFSAGVAGAYAAVRIAAVSTELLDAAKVRDDMDYIDSLVEKGVRPIIHVAQLLTTCYEITKSLSHSRTRYELFTVPEGDDEAPWEQLERERIGESFKALFLALSETLNKLADALDSLEYSIFAKSLWSAIDQSGGVGDMPSVLRFRAATARLDASATVSYMFNRYSLVFEMANEALRDAGYKEEDIECTVSFVACGVLLKSKPNKDEFSILGLSILAQLAAHIPKDHQQLQRGVEQVLRIPDVDRKSKPPEGDRRSKPLVARESYEQTLTAFLFSTELENKEWVAPGLKAAEAILRKNAHAFNKLQDPHKTTKEIWRLVESHSAHAGRASKEP